MHPILWIHDKAVWMKDAAPFLSATAAWLSFIAALVGAIVALVLYFKNGRLERAKWAERFFTKFYECGDDSYLRRVRNTLDHSADNKSVNDMVENETSEFTDYLNFFELLAYFVKAKQLKREDVTELFDYYLDCMNRHKAVRKYIADESHGYENLKELLASNK